MLVEQMHLVVTSTSDDELIIEALKSDSNLKIMCACIALQRMFDSFFLDTYTSYPPKDYKNKR